MRAAHREYGVRVPSRSAPFAWFGLGQDGLAIRTGQLRSIRSRLTRSWSRSREIPRTFDRATSKATPHGVSSDGPPAPHRLEQPSPRTSPISDIPRRHRGHRLAGSRTDRKLMKRTPCDAHPTLDPRDLDRRPAAPFGASAPQSGCLPSCLAGPGSPRTLLSRSPSCLKASRDTRTVLTSEPPRRAPARHAECSSASVASLDSPCGLPNGADARCVGPTSAISLLRTSTRASPVLDASPAFAGSHAR